MRYILAGSGKAHKSRYQMDILFFSCFSGLDGEGRNSACHSLKGVLMREKACLMQAGLGLKMLGLCETDNPELFMKEVIEAYPKLGNADGFELVYVLLTET